MPIYKVTFAVDVYVSAADEKAAEEVGYERCADEVKNGTHECFSCELIKCVEDAGKDADSIPWTLRTQSPSSDSTIREIILSSQNK